MFYENVNRMCKERRVSITKMATDIGLSNAASSSWKKGSVPKGDTLQKIADYFDVSIDVLLRDTQATGQTIGEAHGSSVVFGGNSGNVSSSYNDADSEESKLSDQEMEIIRSFRALPLRGQAEVIAHLFQVEDKYKDQ